MRTDGTFMCFLDHVLVYEERAPQIYGGATAGGWYSEGIYLPGNERNIDTLTVYTQGYRQGYPGESYSNVVGRYPVYFKDRSPLLGAGAHLGYRRDIDGKQRPNPPSIGAYDVATLRTVA